MSTRQSWSQAAGALRCAPCADGTTARATAKIAAPISARQDERRNMQAPFRRSGCRETNAAELSRVEGKFERPAIQPPPAKGPDRLAGTRSSYLPTTRMEKESGSIGPRRALPGGPGGGAAVA